MRTLKFNVDELIVSPDPNCDFSGLVPGTSGYLQCEFNFSPEWNGTRKVVEFRRGITEYSPQLLEDGKTCMIPEEVLQFSRFEIRVHGRKEGLRLRTNKLDICQKGD